MAFIPREVKPYAEAAEYREDIKGWVCRTCGRYHGDDGGSERQTRYCCTKQSLCDVCGIPTKPYTLCPQHMAERDAARYAALPRVEWDGTTPLCIWDRDTYFFSPEALDEYLYDNELALDDVCLEVCEGDKGPVFSLIDFLCDCLPEDADPPGDWKDVEKVVNGYLVANRPFSWIGGGKVPTRESVERWLRPAAGGA